MEPVSRDDSLATVWLLATFSRERNRSRVNSVQNKKCITKINIARICQCIIDVSDNLSLQKISNLMYGTVLAYKRQCLCNWRAVNNCRMVIQRLSVSSDNYIHQTKHRNSGITRIHLLKDDPTFDISIGLVADFEGVLNEKRDPFKDQTFQEEFESSFNSEQSPPGDLPLEFITQDKWDGMDMKFIFDANGDVVGQGENNEIQKKVNETPNEEDIQNTLTTEADINSFEIAPELNLELQCEEQEQSIGSQKGIAKPVLRGEKIKAAKKKRRLVIDYDISLSVADMQTLINGYRDSQECILMKRLSEQELDSTDYLTRKLTSFTGFIKSVNTEYGNSNSDRNGNDGFNNHGLSEHRLIRDETDNFNGIDMNVEYGRTHAHTRSSSISSVEGGRHAVDHGSANSSFNHRHSSSFHFDFSQRRDNGDGANDGDIAQLDISYIGLEGNGCGYDGGSQGFELEEEDLLDKIDVDEMYKGLKAVQTFGNLKNMDASTRRDVAHTFMLVLELACSGKISVSQQGLFTDIRIDKH